MQIGTTYACQLPHKVRILVVHAVGNADHAESHLFVLGPRDKSLKPGLGDATVRVLVEHHVDLVQDKD